MQNKVTVILSHKIEKIVHLKVNRLNVRIGILIIASLFCKQVFSQTTEVSKIQKDTSKTDKIGAVEIKGQRNIIENTVDKLVYNTALDITSRGLSASDMFSKVPMVEVDMDGNVSLRGNKNVKILINGRPSGLLSGNVADALKSLPADDILAVEVMTNPSVKYDGDGSGGVINIVMKDTRLKGKSGSFRLGLGTRSNNIGGNYSIQKGKTNYTANLGGHMWRTWGDATATRINSLNGTNYAMQQKSNFDNWGGGPRLTLSVDHQFNKQNSLTVSGSVNTNFRSNISDWKTNVGLADSTLNPLWAQSSDRFTTTLGYDGNIDYKHKFEKKDREFSWSAQYTSSTDYADYISKRENPTSVNILTHQEKSRNIGRNNELSTQMDFIEPVSKKLTIESGAKAIWRTVFSGYNFDSLYLLTKEYTPISSRNNQFNYYQNVYAAYLQTNWTFNAVYSLKLGVRYEQTQFGGSMQYPNDFSFTGKTYHNWIPFVNLAKKISKTGFVKFNFTQRIQRPSLFYLNPYTNYSDPLNITTGNIQLAPEVSTNYEFSYSDYGSAGGFGINLYHKQLNNAIETYRNVDANRVYRTTYGNIAQNLTTGFDGNANLKGNNWMLSINGGLGWVQIKSTLDSGSVKGLHSEGITYSLGCRASYTYKKRWMFELFSRVNAPLYSLQGYTANWFFHMIGVKRRFKNDKGGIGFGIDNPLTPVVDYKTVNNGIGFSYNEIRRTQMWGFRINFDYSFGSIETEKPKTPERKLKNDDLKDGENNAGQ